MIRGFFRRLVVLLGVAAFSVPSLSAEKQILRHIEWPSRDFYYIHIDEPEEIFQVSEYVGGEHENEYNFLGFSGDTFLIVIQSVDDGDPDFSFRGDGFKTYTYDRKEADIKGAYSVTVTHTHTWVSIGLSAHPAAEYVLTVKKVQEESEN